MRLLLFLVFSAGAVAEPSFVGVLAGEGRTLFALTPSNGESSRWLAAGQEMDGYVIRAYLPQREALEVERAGVHRLLPLRRSKVQAVAPAVERLFAIARREIAARDGWSAEFRVEEADPRDGDYRVIVTRERTSEARLVTISKDGAVKDYQKI